MTAAAPTTDNHNQALRIGARIDRLSHLTKSHRAIAVILAALFAFDVIDLSAYSLVASSIRAAWGLSLESLGVLTSMVYVGMFVGAIVGGRLADRFGRKTVILVAVATFSLGSLGSAIAPNFEVLAITRVLTGVGIAATSAILYVLVNELFPKSFRGRMMATVLTVGTIGAPLIVGFSLVVVPAGMWHLVFVAGGLGIIVAAIAIKVLPESPRWLASRGRSDEAERLVAKFERQFQAAHPQVTLPEPIVEEVKTATKSSLWAIFKPRFIRRTLIATGLFFLMLSLQAGVGQWLPTILIERGYPAASALGITFILTFAGIAGGVIGLFIIDRFERKWLLVGCAIVVAVTFAAMGYIDSVVVIILAGIVNSLATAVIASGVATYATEIFPTEIRAVGTGFSNGFARLGGIINSLLIGVIFTAFAVEGVFTWFILLVVLFGIIAALGPRVGVVAARRARIAELAGERSQPMPDSLVAE
ncbi:MFS transporter [Subtercola endophyticus]|uniref:MFS transporter n=1 Tax=Subtercola endophyticus TaxID=2895559 RepID=UPI001E52E5D1|nr:MFS transporter [Subtercola endophyticus]UFS58734.1 MFS transporter [Subtercola endophyticus]